MCRSIQPLRAADPPASEAEVRDAALQYVRKISGSRTPSKANVEVFEAAVEEIAAATRRLVDGWVASPGTKPAVPVQRRLAASGP